MKRFIFSILIIYFFLNSAFTQAVKCNLFPSENPQIKKVVVSNKKSAILVDNDSFFYIKANYNCDSSDNKDIIAKTRQYVINTIFYKNNTLCYILNDSLVLPDTTIYDELFSRIEEVSFDEKYLLAITDNYKLLQIDKETHKLKIHRIKLGSKIEAVTLYSDNDDRKWLGTSDGIYFFSEEYDSLQSIDDGWFRPKGEINKIKEFQDNLWCAGENGLWKFEGFKEWKHVLPPTAFKDLSSNYFNGITDFEFDESGNIWMQTKYEILLYNGTNKLSVIDDIGINTEILSMAIDTSRQRLWIGTNGNGLYYYDYLSQIEYNRDGWAILRTRKESTKTILNCIILPCIERNRTPLTQSNYFFSTKTKFNANYKYSNFETSMTVLPFGVWGDMWSGTDSSITITAADNLDSKTILHEAWAELKLFESSFKIGRQEIEFDEIKLFSPHSNSLSEMFYDAVFINFQKTWVKTQLKINAGYSWNNNGNNVLYNSFEFLADDPELIKKDIKEFNIFRVGLFSPDTTTWHLSTWTIISGHEKIDRPKPLYYKYTHGISFNWARNMKINLRGSAFIQHGKNYEYKDIIAFYGNIELGIIDIQPWCLSFGADYIQGNDMSDKSNTTNSFDMLFGEITPYANSLLVNNIELFSPYISGVYKFSNQGELFLKLNYYHISDNVANTISTDYLYFQNWNLALSSDMEYRQHFGSEKQFGLNIKVGGLWDMEEPTYRKIRYQYGNKDLLNYFYCLLSLSYQLTL